MSKARTIKNNHAMGVRSKVNETAGFEIFYLCAISMNQQEWLPASAFDIVQAHAIDIKELSTPWMTLLRTGRLAPSKAPPTAIATAYFSANKDDRAGADIRPSFIFESLYERARFRAHSMIAA